MCPSLNGKSCVDPEGVIYGILCDIQFSGIVITNSGKKFLLERDEDMKQIEREETYGGKEKRDYAGEFNICAGFCDSFDAAVSSHGRLFHWSLLMSTSTVLVCIMTEATAWRTTL